MSGLERLIVDLVQIAEAPLYSTYRWLGRQLGRDLPLSEFLRVVAAAIERDVVRLWHVDANTGDRTELYGLPSDLKRQYAAEVSLDSRYDPFGMSLTLGGAVDVDADPEWEFTVDFDDRVFEITAMPGLEEEALGQLSRCYPDLRPTVTASEDRGELRHLVGTLRHATGS
ncbi:MAG: hypothetical protein M5U19_00195 [Microthrixaceae bacterium]|nr:hypothetical protein [Microthrixaceae bacterium]